MDAEQRWALSLTREELDRIWRHARPAWVIRRRHPVVWDSELDRNANPTRSWYRVHAPSSP